MKLTLLAFPFLASILFACAPAVQTVAYTAQPTRIDNPKEELKSLILANTVQGCVTEPTFVGATFVVKYVCTGGIHGGVASSTVLRLDRVRAIDLQQQGEWYRVRVQHADGIDDFVWDSRTLEDAQRIDDAITALVGHG